MCPRVCRERVRPQQKPVRRMPGATGSPAHLRIHSLWEASGYIAGIISSKCQQEISTNLKPGRIPERCNGRGGRPISPVATLANRDGDGHRPPLRRTSGGSARLPPRTRRHPAGEKERKGRAPSKMPDATAKMAAVPPEVRRKDFSNLGDDSQPYLHSEMRPKNRQADSRQSPRKQEMTRLTFIRTCVGPRKTP